MKVRKASKALAAPRLHTSFGRLGERMFLGFAVDLDAPHRKFTIELLVDGHSIKVARADGYDHDLAQQQIGDGCYGFLFSVPKEALGNSSVVEARLANLGLLVGAPIELANSDSRPAADPSGPGQVRWIGGLRFNGWLGGDGTAGQAQVFVDGKLVMQVRARGWTHLGTCEDDARAVRSFDFHLPQRFADGSARQLEIVTDRGQQLVGSPAPFLAFANGLKALLVREEALQPDQLTAEFFDRLVPMSWPLSQYESWRAQVPDMDAGDPTGLIGVIMVGGSGVEDTIESLNVQERADWIAAAMPARKPVTSFRPADLKRFLETDGKTCDLVVFGFSGTTLRPLALARFAAAFSQFPNAQLAYGDLEVRGPDGSLWPLAFPAVDYERMLEQGYGAYCFAMRRASVDRALAAGATDLFRLFNSVVDAGLTSTRDIIHIPGAVATLSSVNWTAAGPALVAATDAHLRARGSSATTALGSGQVLPAARILRQPRDKAVSIIIPTRNRQSLLQACIESIQPALPRHDVELIIVDNDSSDSDARDYLASIDGHVGRVLRVEGAFNFSRLNNIAAETATSEVLCLLNNDVKALDSSWLEEMLGRIVEPDVGAVGALLLWPSGVVQHGGVVLGPSFAATHAFNDRTGSDPGYCDLLSVAHECSAVTAACMMTRRNDYRAVGGMDEVRFPVTFNDVDYCLKLRALGKRIVFTPHARLLHLQSASRGDDMRPDQKQRFERELQNLRAKWGNVLADDPYYNPMLSLDAIPFSALAWPLRPMAARTNSPPVPSMAPPGL